MNKTKMPKRAYVDRIWEFNGATKGNAFDVRYFFEEESRKEPERIMDSDEGIYLLETPVLKYAEDLLVIVEGIRGVCDVPQIVSERIDVVLDAIEKEEKELLEE